MICVSWERECRHIGYSRPVLYKDVSQPQNKFFKSTFTSGELNCLYQKYVLNTKMVKLIVISVKFIEGHKFCFPRSSEVNIFCLLLADRQLSYAYTVILIAESPTTRLVSCLYRAAAWRTVPGSAGPACITARLVHFRKLFANDALWQTAMLGPPASLKG